MRILLLNLIFLTCFFSAAAQDTFSIVAADSATREVGSAGASCVDLFAFGISDPGFLADLLPNIGAINTQSYYLAVNQDNAKARMVQGDTPEQIISWLIANDASGNPAIRQYGIVGFTGINNSAAAHTGADCFDYKNHITGNINGIYYSIQGNILSGQNVLDEMERRFRNAQGDLACRLMAALQGANTSGADTRCGQYNTSSLFAFLKVAQPSDPYGSPSFNISVATRSSNLIEPVDSLQTIFNLQKSCLVSALGVSEKINDLKIFPNPASDVLFLICGPSSINTKFSIADMWGRVVMSEEITSQEAIINISDLSPGIYLIRIGNNYQRFLKIK
jgi:uncharacterized Ntn-hydrolase superfamily protein